MCKTDLIFRYVQYIGKGLICTDCTVVCTVIYIRQSKGVTATDSGIYTQQEQRRRVEANKHHCSWRQQCSKNKNAERQLLKFMVAPTSTNITNQPSPGLPPRDPEPRLDWSTQCWVIMAGESYLWSPARDPSLCIDQIRKCLFYFSEDPKDDQSTIPTSHSKQAEWWRRQAAGKKHQIVQGGFYCIHPSSLLSPRPPSPGRDLHSLSPRCQPAAQ